MADEETEGQYKGLLHWAALQGITDRPPHQQPHAAAPQDSCLGFFVELMTFPDAGGCVFHVHSLKFLSITDMFVCVLNAVASHQIKRKSKEIVKIYRSLTGAGTDLFRRGLAAARDLKLGDLVLRVPERALMSVRSAKQDAELGRALCLYPSLSSVQVEIFSRR